MRKRILDVAAIVLAAGRSSRMGQHKLLLPLGGRPLVTYAVDAACGSSAEPVIVVVGHSGGEVAVTLAERRCRIVTNESFADGMATSLHAGIAALPADIAGALFLLGDQPLVTSALVDVMLDAVRAEPQDIHAAAYKNGRRGNPVYFRGNPVYFPSIFFAELLGVSGDEGGRSVLARHSDRMRLVPMPYEDAAIDVDTPGEYDRLIAGWDRYSKIIMG